MSEQEPLPVMDNVQSDGPSEADLLDAVMRNSPIMEEAGIVPLPEEQVDLDDPAEPVDEDPDTEEVVRDEEEVVETEEELEEDEDAPEGATQEAESYSLDELEDFQVMVKIDGEVQSVNIQDLVKGYTTDASLSKKGRELGEARKELEAEREAKLQELNVAAQATNQMLFNAENSFSNQYHELDKQITQARKDGDTFELGELKDKREEAQKNYWDARKHRESIMAQVQEQTQKREQEQFQAQIDHFHKEIPSMIPDFNEKVASSIRDFAVSKGIAEDSLVGITDPNVIKFIDDFRRLEQGISTGKAKRKAVPKRSVPTKKATPATKKKQAAEDRIRAKALSGEASKEDQDAFAKQLALRSLGNI